MSEAVATGGAGATERATIRYVVRFSPADFDFVSSNTRLIRLQLAFNMRMPILSVSINAMENTLSITAVPRRFRTISNDKVQQIFDELVKRMKYRSPIFSPRGFRKQESF